MIIDVHTHIFPDFPQFVSLNQLDQLVQLMPGIEKWRNNFQLLTKPFSKSVHVLQPWIRHLPESIRRNMDELGGFGALLHLLVESSPKDLLHCMDKSEVDFAVVIAQPPYLSNDTLLEICKDNPRFIPAVNISKDVIRPVARFKSYVKAGAKALKINLAADGNDVKPSRYKTLLNTATDLGLPVIIHTGRIHSHLLYKDPERGRAERFIHWFKAYPETQFILAHMNFHEPAIAMDIAQEFPNISVDTSWQPAEIIGEAVRRIGAERILFGTDWPLIGSNIEVGVARIQECVEHGTINEEQSRMILAENAYRLFGIPINAT